MKLLFWGVILVILGSLIHQADANCMQIAQDFKCPYDLLSCKGNEEGECKCKDGTMCRWKDGEPLNENCPCDEPKGRKRRYRDDM